ncbi:MAG: IS21 family transposase [Myxococcales bacterium]|nr:IS21 family transposase [Myxococcales bacterium]MCB9547006.1 IS21 family transposase [Myxococcales bacterium]MCB9746693.1 IS21 family transposase [Alphaproteobacteria bacterium]
MGTGSREVARLLAMSPKTELKYRRALEGAGLLAGEPDALPELSTLRAAVEVAHPPPTPRALRTSVDDWMPTLEQAFQDGVEAKAVWDKLKRTEADFAASYSAVRRAYARLRRARGVEPEDVALPVDTAPGEVAQVDFGYVGQLFDPQSGRVRKAWVFVMVLGFSRHLFARLVFDQSTSTWLELHAEAFRFFGGVPRVVVPDNLKAAVVRAAFGADDRHLLGLNRSYRELARFFGFKVDPAPVRAPEKKGKVESAVRYVKRNFMATCEHEELAPANAALCDWVLRTAGTRRHAATGQAPLAHFEGEERARLLPLPPLSFQAVRWKPATVHADSHVEFEGRLYSAPWRLIGRRVWVRATAVAVELYADDTRVATHERRGPGRRSTNEHHLPEGRRDLRFREESYWQDRANLLGEDVGRYVRAVFESDDVLSKLRDVQAIVTHLESFPAHRARATVLRAHAFGNYTYQGIKRILRDALDLEPLPTFVEPAHGELLQPRFARSAEELLARFTETTHEPH